MYYLVLDTATDNGFVGLYNNEKLIAKSVTPEGKKNSSTLMVELENLWKQAGIKPSDLLFIGVGVGPGSYTGVRVGAVIAKMLALSWGVPLVSVCSLIPYLKEGTLAAFDARISGAYTFENGMPKATPIDEIPTTKTISTPHASLQKRLPNHSVEIREPDIDLFAKEAFSQFKSGNSTTGELEILYLRKTEAEQSRS